MMVQMTVDVRFMGSSNKGHPAPSSPPIGLCEVTRAKSTNVNVIDNHRMAIRKAVIPATVVVTPTVISVTPAGILSGHRRGAHEQGQRCKSDKSCLHDAFSVCFERISRP